MLGLYNFVWGIFLNNIPEAFFYEKIKIKLLLNHLLSKQYSQKWFVVYFGGTEWFPELFGHFARVSSLWFLYLHCLSQGNNQMLLVVMELGLMSQGVLLTDSIGVFVNLNKVILRGVVNLVLWVIGV